MDRFDIKDKLSYMYVALDELLQLRAVLQDETKLSEINYSITNVLTDIETLEEEMRII